MAGQQLPENVELADMAIFRQGATLPDGQCPGRPKVTIHYAQTLDGRIATSTGHSQWISSQESLQLAHELRAAHQAVMVGVGTIVADNPRLTVRLAPGRSPLRVIVDSTLRLPLDALVLADGAARTIIATTNRAPGDRIGAVLATGAKVLSVRPDTSGHVDLSALLRLLLALNVTSVMIEGGRGLITSALRERLVDRLVICIAPKLIGTGIEAIGDLDIRQLGDALLFGEATFARLGEDIIFDGLLRRQPRGDGWDDA